SLAADRWSGLHPPNDPAPNPKLVEEGRPNLNLVIATSDAFFERPKNRVRAQRFFLALIHAPALHAFENLTSLAAPDSIFAIHGCRPHAWMRNENAEGRDCAACRDKGPLIVYRWQFVACSRRDDRIDIGCPYATRREDYSPIWRLCERRDGAFDLVWLPKVDWAYLNAN